MRRKNRVCVLSEPDGASFQNPESRHFQSAEHFACFRHAHAHFPIHLVVDQVRRGRMIWLTNDGTLAALERPRELRVANVVGQRQHRGLCTVQRVARG